MGVGPKEGRRGQSMIRVERGCRGIIIILEVETEKVPILKISPILIPKD